MAGFYVQFKGVHFGKMFDTYEAACEYAKGLNSLGTARAPFTITEI